MAGSTMDPTHEEWLAQRIEDPIDPQQRIIDAHHHLWQRADSTYVIDHLRADAAHHNVQQSVFVQCMAGYRPAGPPEMQPLGETEFVLTQAERSRSLASNVPGSAPAGAGAPTGETRNGPIIAGMVGFADLLLGDDVVPVLEAHLEIGGEFFKGIRHSSAHDPSPDVRVSHTNPPPGLLGDSTFRAGFSHLHRLGLSFDAWLYHPQIEELTDLAEAFPDTAIVLDHLGGPLGIGPYADRDDAVRAEWRHAIAELAQCPNVWVKLGGMAMPIFGFGWHERGVPPSSAQLAQAWQHDIEFCIDAFGPSRCMFESNFPVDRRGASYTTIWNAFQRIVQGADPDTIDQLFYRSAAEFYRLS